MSKRLYRLVLLDEVDAPMRGAQYVHASEETPAPGDQIELPFGTWVVTEVVATWSGDPRAQLVAVDDYGGTLICKPVLTSQKRQ